MNNAFLKLLQLRFYRQDNGIRLLKFLSKNSHLAQIINFCTNLAWRLRVSYQRHHSLKTTTTAVHENTTICELNGQTLFPKQIVIIAELSISQCKKYRVTQKAAMLKLLGFEVQICAWHETEQALNYLQTAGEVIFYRVPAFPSVQQLFHEARRLGLRIGYDVDDIIFCAETLGNNPSLSSLSPVERDAVLNGAKLYHQALTSADYGIASTRTIAEAMQRAGIKNTFIVENALDAEILTLAAQKKSYVNANNGGIIKIGYGSGTKTHDADFKVAAPALKRILNDFPQVRLVIYGLLNTEQIFDTLVDQIWRVDLLQADDYYRALSEFDINLAPLETNIFNDAKSNIKWIEAALFAVPSVCSPAAAFREVIRDGENALLADSETQWYTHLARLVTDANYRQALGRQAKQDVLSQYHWEVIAHTQLHALFPSTPVRGFRVLCANLLFAPQSFGGATIVVEQLAQHLATQHHAEVLVFTGIWDHQRPLFAQERYEVGAVSVIRINLPPALVETEHEHGTLGEIFSALLAAWQPDIVHFHAIQHLGGAALAQACVTRNIPFAITLHDAWWLCARQFQLTPAQVFCGQETIHLPHCANCTQSAALTHHRAYRLRYFLDQAALLLAPSIFQQQLYMSNGFSSPQLRLNKNGILPPSTIYQRTKSPKVRFAYLGGRAAHKGYFLLENSIRALQSDEWTLTLVNIEAHLGKNPFSQDAWTHHPAIQVIEPYSSCDIDNFFSQIDVLLFPSQARESFGLAVREALARDVWVITTDAGGAAEDITPGINGDVVPVGDTAAWIQAVTAILTNPVCWKHYQNPHRDAVRTYATQAAELYQYLQEAAHA